MGFGIMILGGTLDALISKTVTTPFGDRTISVHAQDITSIDFPLDIMTISAFRRNYAPMKGTLVGALDDCGIGISDLASNPEIDLRETSDIWLSRAVDGSRPPI